MLTSLWFLYDLTSPISDSGSVDRPPAPIGADACCRNELGSRGPPLLSRVQDQSLGIRVLEWNSENSLPVWSEDQLNWGMRGKLSLETAKCCWTSLVPKQFFMPLIALRRSWELFSQRLLSWICLWAENRSCSNLGIYVMPMKWWICLLGCWKGSVSPDLTFGPNGGVPMGEDWWQERDRRNGPPKHSKTLYVWNRLHTLQVVEKGYNMPYMKCMGMI